LARTALFCAALLLTAAAPAKPPPGAPARPSTPGIVVKLQSQPGTPMDTAARLLVADDLSAAKARGDRPLVLTGTADIGAERPALFVQLQSRQECGSAGCTTSVYAWDHGGWKQVLDGTTGRLTVSSKRTRGRADLLTDEDHFVWTGAAYRSTAPAPAVDLRPHPRPRRR
jgi:hypothetical protein